jgi:3-oxoacyl-[acyl-carrier-protein] synthase-3
LGSKLKAVGITGLGSFLPETIRTNKEFAEFLDTTEEWIVTRTGIKERRYASTQEACSDLGLKAAQLAMKDAGVRPEELDLIIVATVTPDMFFPSTACLIQKSIGAKGAAAMDISAACTGFIYALAVGSQFVATGMYDKVLVVAAEVLSKMINYEDRTTAILFGDGAGAAILQPVSEGQGFLAFELGSDGNGADLLKIPAGGSRKPATRGTVSNKEHFITMNGNEVFKFAVRVMGDAAIKVLAKAELNKKDIDFLIPHQANTRIIDSAVKRLGLPSEKVFVNVDKYGNMSSASIPVALKEAVEKGLIKEGDLVLLVGFGAGLTWGASVIKWSKRRE